MRYILRTKPVLLFSVFFLSLLTGCSSKKDSKSQIAAVAAVEKQKSMPTRVDAFVVSAKSIGNIIDVPGSIIAFEGTELHPEVSGRVTILNVKEGTTVARGMLLVKLFDGDLQAQLKKLEVQLAIKEKTEQRQAELLKINGISQQEYDLSALDVSNIKADIELIRTSILKTEIRAPFTGKLGLRNISIGAYITPQTIITTIREVENLKLEFTVPEKYSSQIKTGMPVMFMLDGSDKKFNAKIIASESSVAEDNRSLKVRAIISSKDAMLSPGIFTKVSLDFGVDNNAIMIPSQAVIPQARFKNVILYKNGAAKFAVVQTGVRDSAFVQILSGVEIGDTVITTGLLSIKPDGDIQLTSVKQ